MFKRRLRHQLCTLRCHIDHGDKFLDHAAYRNFRTSALDVAVRLRGACGANHWVLSRSLRREALGRSRAAGEGNKVMTQASAFTRTPEPGKYVAFEPAENDFPTGFPETANGAPDFAAIRQHPDFLRVRRRLTRFIVPASILFFA